MFNITRVILKTIGPASGNVMFVDHAATLEACTRQLIGARPRTLTKTVRRSPTADFVCVRRASLALSLVTSLILQVNSNVDPVT